LLLNLTNRNDSFQEFLERQQLHLVKKETDTEKIKQEINGTFKPKINTKSFQLTKKKGTFMERLENATKKVEIVVIDMINKLYLKI
jgi:hypothetical protein